MSHSELVERVKAALVEYAARIGGSDGWHMHCFSLLELRVPEVDQPGILDFLEVHDSFSVQVGVKLLHRWEDDHECGSEVVNAELEVVLYARESERGVELHAHIWENLWELIPKGSPGYVPDEVYGPHVPAFL